MQVEKPRNRIRVACSIEDSCKDQAWCGSCVPSSLVDNSSTHTGLSLATPAIETTKTHIWMS